MSNEETERLSVRDNRDRSYLEGMSDLITEIYGPLYDSVRGKMPENRAFQINRAPHLKEKNK